MGSSCSSAVKQAQVTVITILLNAEIDFVFGEESLRVLFVCTEEPGSCLARLLCHIQL